ncbi:MAG: hypothetical protein AAF399_11935 [Bacteroidota bacterium]
MPTRRTILSQLLAGIGGTLLFPTWTACQPASDLQRLLQQAGNQAEEADQLHLLRQGLELPTLTQAQRNALTELYKVVDQWVNGRDIYDTDRSPTPGKKRYLHSFFNQQVSPEKWTLPRLPEEDPLFPLLGWYHARMLAHELIEHGGIQANPEKREAYLGEILRLSGIAQQAFPKNAKIGMYMGTSIPWESGFQPPAQAPLWATQQREVLEKLTDILHWWVDERQLPDGQFGGGWGDDVEMWREWMPILVAFEDPKLSKAQALLAESLFAQPYMRGGYTSKMTDVEHTAEDSADTCSAMMHLRPNDPAWQQRALRLVELMETQWTGVNERGFLHFQSTYFTAQEVSDDPRKACDTVYHPRTIQPALLLWQWTDNPQVGKLVLRWMEGWLDATAREEHGKPAGILPSAIHWPDGRVGGLTEDWWRPGNHNDDPLYVWPSAMPMMLDTLLLCFEKTQQDRYLTPLFSMTKIYRAWKQVGSPNAKTPGGETWCASQMEKFLPDAWAKYRMLSGDPQFDDLLLEKGNGYIHFLLTGKRDRLEQEIAKNVQSLSMNQAAFTHDVRWTDRVFRFHRNFLNHFLAEPLPTLDTDALFAILTGHVGNSLYFPIHALRWGIEARKFAALVKEANSTQLVAEVFSFDDSPLALSWECLRLQAGAYQVQVMQMEPEKVLSTSLQTIEEGDRTMNVDLPPQTLCELRVLIEK